MNFAQQYRQIRHAGNTVINFVPQQEAWVVERMGKFYKVLEPVSIKLKEPLKSVMFRALISSFLYSIKSNMCRV